VCGNGGSAADAQHISAELVGRFKEERKGLPCIALTTDTSMLTAWSNDYDFDSVFARQVEAHGRRGDVLVCISTSGNSTDVVEAAKAAPDLKINTIGLLGGDGGTLAGLVDIPIVIEHVDTARVQEVHQIIYHAWCGEIDAAFAS
jgi:D-sedoheptulose 7-phosphate isomerase